MQETATMLSVSMLRGHYRYAEHS